MAAGTGKFEAMQKREQEERILLCIIILASPFYLAPQIQLMLCQIPLLFPNTLEQVVLFSLVIRVFRFALICCVNVLNMTPNDMLESEVM